MAESVTSVLLVFLTAAFSIRNRRANVLFLSSIGYFDLQPFQLGREGLVVLVAEQFSGFASSRHPTPSSPEAGNAAGFLQENP